MSNNSSPSNNSRSNTTTSNGNTPLAGLNYNNNNNNVNTTSNMSSNNNTNDNSNNNNNMDSRQQSDNNNNNKIMLDHKVEKYIKHIGNPAGSRPGSSPFSSVTFCAKITGIEIVQNNNRNNNNNNNNSSDNMTSKYIPLVDSFDTNKPLDALLGVTRIFKGLEIALRSMCVGERADFVVPPEIAHFYGGGQLPRGCFLEIDLLLVSCENATTIPKLPMIDFEPYKIVQSSGASKNSASPKSGGGVAAAASPKKAYLGSTVDFLLQELDERTGLMSPSTKLQIVAGAASTNPLLDMMVMSMYEREISTFILRISNNNNNNNSSGQSGSGRNNNGMGNNTNHPPQQFYITVIRVVPAPMIPIPICPSMIMKVYDPQQQQQQEDAIAEQQQQQQQSQQQQQQGSSPDSTMTKSFSDTLVAQASLSNVDLAPFSPQIVEQTLDFLQETAKKLFEADACAPATWFFAAASSIMRQKSTIVNAPAPNIAETNKVLARLARNMGRCAYKQRRFAESLHLARESYSFDSSDAKGVFLLAQALRANDLLNEASKILAECEKMPECQNESLQFEKETLMTKLAAKNSAPPSPAKQ